MYTKSFIRSHPFCEVYVHFTDPSLSIEIATSLGVIESNLRVAFSQGSTTRGDNVHAWTRISPESGDIAAPLGDWVPERQTDETRTVPPRLSVYYLVQHHFKISLLSSFQLASIIWFTWDNPFIAGWVLNTHKTIMEHTDLQPHDNLSAFKSSVFKKSTVQL